MRGAKSIAVVVAVTVMVTVSFEHQAQGAIPWAANWEQASARAERYRQLVLIHFTRGDCPPCVKLERSVLSRPEVRRAIASNYVPLKADASEDGGLSHRYGVEQVPTDIMVTPEGTEVWRATSPQDPNQYIAMLDRVAAHQQVGTPLKSPSDSRPRTASSSTASSSTASSSTASSGAPSSSPWDLNRASAFPVDGGTSNSTHPTSGVGWPHGTNRGADFTPSSRSTDPARSADFQGAERSRFMSASSQGRGAASQSPGFSPAGTSSPSPGIDGSRSNPFIEDPTEGPASQSRAHSDSNTPSYRANRPNVSPSSPGQASAAQETLNQFATDRSTSASHPAASQVAGSDGYGAQADGSEASRQSEGDPMNLALAGHCCVTLVEEEKWVKGDPRWGVNHRGRTYLFTGPQQQQRFLDGYDEYAPVLSGYDCVRYAERGVLVEGKCEHGVFYRDRIFLFADESSLDEFWQAPSRFVAAVARDQARRSAGPTR